MRKTLLLLAFALVSGGAQAQIKCWNEGGKRVCGDAPPAGAKVTTLNTPSAPSAPAAAATKDGKAASKGPLTPAEREAESRKRQADAQKSSEKAAADQQEAAAKRENCERARASMRDFESGQRIARTDSKGERYFLDDNQIAQELSKARQVAQQACSG